MKIIKCFIIFACAVLSFSVPVLAKDNTVKINFEENQIEFKIPSDYKYYTADDIDNKNADYFKNLPVNKQEAKEKRDSGIYFNAFYEKNESQMTLRITSDNFTRKIGNFTPMDDNDKQSVIKSFKSIYERNGQNFLTEPDIIEVDDYDFIRVNCRIGNGETGYSYKSILTIIGGNCYEFVKYNSVSVPDDEVNNEFDNIVSSMQLKIKGESGEIVKSLFMSALTIIFIIVGIIIVCLFVYSLIREIIVYKNRGEKVRLKKR